jgi:hypothetical protein
VVGFRKKKMQAHCGDSSLLILVIWKAAIRRTTVQSQLWKKFEGLVAHTCHPSYVGKHKWNHSPGISKNLSQKLLVQKGLAECLK